MKRLDEKRLALDMEKFLLPRYLQLPDMGLYLEQTGKYINQCLAPLGCVEITSSMIRNYVKMGLVKSPVKKQYFRDQLAHLIAITLLKPAMSLENIKKMFQLQQAIYTDQVAYDYFCAELENMLHYRFGISAALQDVGSSSSLVKEMLQSAIVTVSNIIYLNTCFRLLSGEVEPAEETETN